MANVGDRMAVRDLESVLRVRIDRRETVDNDRRMGLADMVEEEMGERESLPGYSKHDR